MLKRFFGYVFWTLMMIVLSIMLGCDRKSTIDYFGQELPGSIPKVLAPGFISTEEHGEMACTFMPDGREFYFTRMDNAPGTQRIMVSRFVNGVWTKPEVAPFSREYVNLEPHITPDGRRLVFVSERPIQGQPPLDGNQLWVMERTRYGWGEPRYIRPGMFASVALDGTLYYTDMSNWPSPPGIVSSKLVDGEYTESQVLDGGVNSPMFGAHPCIAPDQSFIIFDSFRRDGEGGGKKPDLYVSFRKDDGSWGPALNLGDNINHTGSNLGASLSPDGKYLFFSSEGDIFWVDAKIIEKLKKESNPPEGSGVIAFSVTPADDNNEIYIINADGSGLQQLTNHQGRDCAPAWSPDATKIAFYVHYDETHTWSIFVMGADGGNIQRLTEEIGVRDHSPSWSPDGKYIVFGRGTSGPSEIWRMNADGSDLRKYDSITGGGPKLSPDGTRITFHSNSEGNSEIYVMGADGSNQKRLTHNNADDWWPSWSPDGNQIVFQSNRDGNYEIYKMNSDGTNPARLTNNRAEDAEPAWSPDGEKIAFSSFRDGKFEIYIMNADGSNTIRLTHVAGQAIQPSWRPLERESREILK